jgi:uncharacterized protein YjlB
VSRGGSAKIECGGIKGRVLLLKAGDVLVLPANAVDRLIDASRNFLVVGAYPEDGTYDDARTRGSAPRRLSALLGSANRLKTLCTERAVR